MGKLVGLLFIGLVGFLYFTNSLAPFGVPSSTEAIHMWFFNNSNPIIRQVGSFIFQYFIPDGNNTTAIISAATQVTVTVSVTAASQPEHVRDLAMNYLRTEHPVVAPYSKPAELNWGTGVLYLNESYCRYDAINRVTGGYWIVFIAFPEDATQLYYAEIVFCPQANVVWFSWNGGVDPVADTVIENDFQLLRPEGATW